MWVQKQKNGKYQLVERYTDELTGKQKKISVTLERNTPQCRRTAEIVLLEKIDSTPKKNNRTTLEDLVEAYRQDQKKAVKQSTYKRNYFACDTLMRYLGNDILIDKLTAKYVRKAFLDTRLNPGTLNELIVRFKALIRWGYKNDLIDDLSCINKLELFRDIPHKQKIQDKFLEENELIALLDQMKRPIWKLLTEFLALSGLRVGEAIALNKKDIDFKTRLIHVSKTYDSINKIVTTPKTLCSIRDVFIQDELLTVCKEIRVRMLEQKFQYGYERSDLFFENKNGDYISYYTYNKYLQENAQQVLGRKITPHALRHTHASLLMAQGISIDAISRRLGHENSRITREIYLHVTDKLREKDYDEIKAIKII